MRHGSKISQRFRVPLGLVAINVTFAAVFSAIALSAYHAPTPHALPVGIVAPAPVAAQVRGALDARAPGGFDLRAYPGAAQAHAGIVDRRVDGAVIATPHAMTLLVAAAGGSAPAQLLTTTFSAVATRTRRQFAVIDVVPPLRDDSLALSPFFTVLCVLFPSLAVGAVSAHLFRRHRTAWRVAVPAVTAAAIGLAAAAVADGISGSGHYLAIAGIVALFSLAISAPTAALGRLRLPLIALAVLTFLIFGIPASGGPSDLGAFGPGFLRALDGLLPLGIAADAVRNVIYFHGHDTAAHLWVLSAWAGAGVAALLIHPARTWLSDAGVPLRTARVR